MPGVKGRRFSIEAQLLELMLEGVLVVAGDKIVYANPAAQHIIGVAEQELSARGYMWPGWELLRLDGTRMPIEETAAMRVQATGQPVRGALIGLRHEGKPDITWMNVSAVPINFQDGHPGVLVVFRDITELIEVQKEREQAIALQAEALRVQAETLRLQAEFIQNASHEMRTPLHLIFGFSEELAETNLTEEQDMCVRVIRSRAAQLRDLVEDYLVLYEADEGSKEKFARFDLAAVVRSVATQMAVVAKEKGVTLYTGAIEPAVVYGHDLMMTQVCDNLLANAIKFAPKGEVRISLYKRDGHAVLEVSDNGIGIPADKIPNIFKRFYQVNADTKRRFGGSGIGLAVVRQVVDLHGGVIEVESAEGRGSTFKVYLKLANEVHYDK